MTVVSLALGTRTLVTVDISYHGLQAERAGAGLKRQVLVLRAGAEAHSQRAIVLQELGEWKCAEALGKSVLATAWKRDCPSSFN